MPGSACGCAGGLNAVALPKTQLLFFKTVKSFSCQRNTHRVLMEGRIWAEIKVWPDCTGWILRWYKLVPTVALTARLREASSPTLLAVSPRAHQHRGWALNQKTILTTSWLIQKHIFIRKLSRFYKDETFSERIGMKSQVLEGSRHLSMVLRSAEALSCIARGWNTTSLFPQSKHHSIILPHGSQKTNLRRYWP